MIINEIDILMESMNIFFIIMIIGFFVSSFVDRIALKKNLFRSKMASMLFGIALGVMVLLMYPILLGGPIIAQSTGKVVDPMVYALVVTAVSFLFMLMALLIEKRFNARRRR